MNEDDTFTEDVYESEVRQCSENCSHYDSLNRCCWIVPEELGKLCSEVEEGDYCLYGFKENSWK